MSCSPSAVRPGRATTRLPGPPPIPPRGEMGVCLFRDDARKGGNTPLSSRKVTRRHAVCRAPCWQHTPVRHTAFGTYGKYVRPPRGIRIVRETNNNVPRAPCPPRGIQAAHVGPSPRPPRGIRGYRCCRIDIPSATRHSGERYQRFRPGRATARLPGPPPNPSRNRLNVRPSYSSREHGKEMRSKRRSLATWQPSR